MPAERALRWTAPARNDLVAAHQYLVERNPAAARDFARKVRHLVASLPNLPRRGRRLGAVPLAGEYRSLVLAPYRIVYRVDDQVVFIMRIWDCRQDPARLWEELEG
jgi:toxin ParE1/3/4